MFEKIGRLAEAAATNVSVSRRGFFGQLGRGALVVAGALGGLLSATAPVRADPSGGVTCLRTGTCTPPAPGCVFVGAYCAGSYLTRARPKPRCYWNCNGTFTYNHCTGGKC
jgi:hypothetical protein